MTRPGYVCDCLLGSPEPHKVVFVAMLHERKCPIRRKITSSANGFDMPGFPS
jgi:hypothetical protein